MQVGTTILEIVGFALLVAGAFMLSIVAGVFAAGAACILVGALLGRTDT